MFPLLYKSGGKTVCAFLIFPFPPYSDNNSSTNGIDRNQTMFQTCRYTAAKKHKSTFT